MDVRGWGSLKAEVGRPAEPPTSPLWRGGAMGWAREWGRGPRHPRTRGGDFLEKSPPEKKAERIRDRPAPGSGGDQPRASDRLSGPLPAAVGERRRRPNLPPPDESGDPGTIPVPGTFRRDVRYNDSCPGLREPGVFVHSPFPSLAHDLFLSGSRTDPPTRNHNHSPCSIAAGVPGRAKRAK